MAQSKSSIYMDWPAVCARKMRHVMDVIQVNVRTKTGVKTDNVLFPGGLDIVMNVMKIAEKDC